MKRRLALSFALLALAAGCAIAQRDAAEGSRHTHRFQLPPAEAAACFARNARDHSGALVVEARMQPDGSALVIVRVKNGVPYATAEMRRAGRGSLGTIILSVRTSGRRNDLLDALVEGC